MDFSIEYDERILEGIILTLTPTVIEIKMTTPYVGICKKVDLDHDNLLRPSNWPQLEPEFLDISVFFSQNNITSFGKNVAENILKDIYDVCNTIFLNTHVFKEYIERLEDFFNGADFKSLGFTHNQAKIAQKIKYSDTTITFYREQITELETDVQSWFKKYFSRNNSNESEKFSMLIDLCFDVL